MYVNLITPVISNKILQYKMFDCLYDQVRYDKIAPLTPILPDLSYFIELELYLSNRLGGLPERDP